MQEFDRTHSPPGPATPVRLPAAVAVVQRLPTPWFLALAGTAAMTWSAIIVFLVAWSSTTTRRWVHDAAGNFRLETVRRSLAEVWAEQHRNGPVGPLELTGVSMFMMAAIGALLLAWLMLPNVHRRGAIADSLMRSLRAVTAGAGWLCAGTALGGSLIVVLADARFDRHPGPLTVAAVAAAILFGLWGLIAWLTKSTRAAGDARPAPPAAPPTCEGCGYDLTHRPEDDRCPECAFSVARSLTPGGLRPGVDWDEGRDGGDVVVAFLRAVREVLVAPRRFYGRLRVRTGAQRAAWFSTAVYFGFAAGAWLWITCLAGATGGAQDGTFVLFAAVAALAFSLAAWLSHRSVAAAAFAWMARRGELADCRWAAKALEYEAAFVLPAGAALGVLLTSFVLWGDWISDLTGQRVVRAAGLWMPVEPAALLLAAIALAVCWGLRSVLVLRAVRWSNF